MILEDPTARCSLRTLLALPVLFALLFAGLKAAEVTWPGLVIFTILLAALFASRFVLLSERPGPEAFALAGMVVAVPVALTLPFWIGLTGLVPWQGLAGRHLPMAYVGYLLFAVPAGTVLGAYLGWMTWLLLAGVELAIDFLGWCLGWSPSSDAQENLAAEQNWEESDEDHQSWDDVFWSSGTNSQEPPSSAPW